MRLLGGPEAGFRQLRCVNASASLGSREDPNMSADALRAACLGQGSNGPGLPPSRVLILLAV